MNTHFVGNVFGSFARVDIGATFWFDDNGKSTFGLKVGTTAGDVRGAIIFPETDPATFASFLPEDNIADYPLVALPDVYFVPSIAGDDMTLGVGINYSRGNCYIFEGGLITLGFSATAGRPVLVDLQNGIIRPQTTNLGLPIEVRGWSFVAQIWNKPLTLLKHPSDGSAPIYGSMDAFQL